MRKGRVRYKHWRGSIDRPILELLTFDSNPDFGDFGVFCACFANVLRMFCACFANVLRMFCACFAHVLRMFCACFAHVLRVFLEKLNFQAVIKSAASAASPIAWGEPGRRLRLAGDGFQALSLIHI